MRCGAPGAGHRAVAVFRPGCALAWAREIASGTDLVVLARAVTIACSVRRVASGGRRGALCACDRRIRARVMCQPDSLNELYGLGSMVKAEIRAVTHFCCERTTGTEQGEPFR